MAPTRTIDGEEYLASSRASEEFGYSRDYIGQLARGGKVAAEKVGNTWYVSRRDLEFYLALVEQSKQELGGRPRIGAGGEAQTVNERVQEKHVAHTPAPSGASVVRAHQLNGAASTTPLKYERDDTPLIPTVDKKTDTTVSTSSRPERNERSIPARSVTSSVAATASNASERIVRGIGGAPGRAASVAHAVVPLAHTADIIQRALFLSLVTILLSGSMHAVSTGVVSPTPKRVAETWTQVISSDITDTVGNAVVATTHLSLPEQFASSVYERVASTVSFFKSLFSFNFFGIAGGGDEQELSPTSPALTEAERRAIAERLLATSTDESLALITDDEEARAERESARTTPPGSQTVVQQPVVERVIETQRIIERTGLSESEVEDRLTNLENKLVGRIFDIESQSSDNATRIVNNYTNISRTNKIDDLGDVTIHDSSVTDTSIGGSSSFSGTSVSGTEGSFGSLSITGALGGASATFSSTVDIYDTLAVSSLSATGTATSTISGGLLLTKAPTVPHTFSSWETGVSGANPLTATLNINPSSAAADSNLISASVNGSAKFLVDAEGDVFVNNLTSVGETTVSTTTASTFTVEGNTTLGDAITDVTTINGTLTVSGTTTASTVAGNFGVGTTTPWGRLSVAGSAAGSDPLFTISSSTAGFATSTVFHIDSSGRVSIGSASPNNTFSLTGSADISGNLGVGTTSPWKTLSVSETVADAQFSLAYDGTRYANFQVDSVGDLLFDPQGDDLRVNDGNIWLCAGGACPALTATSTTGNIFVEEAVTFGNGFSVVEKASNELGVYNQNGSLIIIFDDGS